MTVHVAVRQGRQGRPALTEPADPAAAAVPFPDGVPRLQDVARRAGVSTATVSRCLNEPGKVSPGTRERVMAAVRELGYAPNFGARALAARRTGIFGAVIPTMENAIFARGLQAFQEALEGDRITLLVASSSYDPRREEEQIRTLIARGADALLLIGHDRTPESYALLERRGIPHVVAWAYDPAAARLSVGFDNRKVMHELALQVLALGHRRLGLITAERAHNDRARERFEGLAAAVAAQGPAAALSVVETTYSIANGAEAFARLMRERPETTAVLCGNDVLAAGALTRAREMGIRVPEQVSITGFDDIDIAAITVPALTTVHVPHRAMGREAARALMAMSRGEDPGPSVDLGATIRWRGSLAAPGASRR